MAASRPASGLVGRLAAEMAAHQPSDDALAHRLGLARQVVEGAKGAERLRAGLVVGSTALRRCGARADLDIVLILDGVSDRPAFASADIEGVHLEIERLIWPQALALTAGDGWTWELRSGSRLGCGLPVFDPHDVATRLRDRAAAQQPDARRWESALREVYLGLAVLGDRAARGAVDGESLRGVFDNLALLTLLSGPRRYQKPKWALADLMHTRQDAMVESMMACYGIQPRTCQATIEAVARTQTLVEALNAALGLPTPAALQAMGHAPQHAEASYVARTLDDAQDLAASGRFLEAQYVAKFAARLAAAQVGPPDSPQSLLDNLLALDASIAALYRGVFADAPAPRRRHLEQALACADALLDAAAPRSVRGAARMSA